MISFYAKCVKGYEFGDNPVEAIVLTPLNYYCYKRCQAECSAFSRTYVENPSSASTEQILAELNDDVISSCYTPCQRGELFSSKIFDVDKANYDGNSQDLPPLKYVGPYSTASSCEQGLASKDVFYKTQFVVKDGDTFFFELSNAPGIENKIFMCGKTMLKINPLFPNTLNPNTSSIDPKKSMLANWYSDSAPPISWRSASDNKCLSKYQNNWGLISDIDVWNNERRSDAGICGWHVKNPYYTNTGVLISDGDEFRISWSGDYAYATAAVMFQDELDSIYSRTKILNQNALFECIGNPNVSEAARSQCREMLYNVSTIFVQSATGKGVPIIGEMARKSASNNAFSASVSADQCADQQSEKCENYSVLGLNGSVIDEDVSQQFNSGVEGCDANSQASYADPKCITIIDYGSHKYSFSGVVTGFSDEKAPLLIKHYPNIPPKNVQISPESVSSQDINALREILRNKGIDPALWPFYIDAYMAKANVIETGYSDMLGGYTVEIDVTGCVFRDGKRVQYAIVSENEGATDLDFIWNDVPQDILEGARWKISTAAEGRLYFRIKPMIGHEVPDSASDEIKKLYTDYGNYGGQYYIMLTKQDDRSSIKIAGKLKKIAIAVDKIMFGEYNSGDISGGLISKIYNATVKNRLFVNLVRVSLTLYMAFAGIAFIMGIIKANKQELLYVLLKIGFVLIIISPESWDFFGGYLVPLCHGGVLEIVKMMIPDEVLSTFQTSVEDLENDIYLPFEFLDYPLQIIFADTTWKKIGGLVYTHLVGWIVALIVIFALVLLALAIIKTTTLYVLCSIYMALLIIILPVVMPFLLFSSTKDIFDRWFRSLLSSFLQPVMVFSAMMTMNLLFIMMLHIVLAFSVCEKCIVLFNYFFGEICLVPGYIILASKHFPPTEGSASFFPLGGVFGLSLCFLIINHGAVVLCDGMSKIAGVMTYSDFLKTDPKDSDLSKGINIIKGAVISVFGQIKNKVAAKANDFMKKQSSTKQSAKRK